MRQKAAANASADYYRKKSLCHLAASMPQYGGSNRAILHSQLSSRVGTYGGWIVPRVVFNLKRQNITAQHETNSTTQN